MNETKKSSFSSCLRGIGLGVGIAGLFLFLFCTTARIDSPEEHSVALNAAFYLPIPLGVSAFLLAYTSMHRRRAQVRIVICVVVGAFVWATGWLVANYRAHYPDRMEQMLHEKGLIH